jgi:1-deoxy-D-xylulose-5-phosphate reductoisomerase
VLNAADEIAVESFLEGRMAFPSIYEIVAETLARMPARSPRTVAEILEIDREARNLARELVTARAGAVTA